MDVSMLRPPRTAAALQPLPRCRVTRASSSSGRPRCAAAARQRSEHRAVYEAVVIGDPTKAADTHERHIRGFWSG
jgi:DNA-binding GntR family transcriptional regulator